MNVRSIRFRLTLWYAVLLACFLFALGSAVYFGLKRYLTSSLEDQLASQAKQIAGTWLGQIEVTGKDYVVNEIDEHLAPAITNRFIRVSRADGSRLYQSKPPHDRSFDPSSIPPAKQPLAPGLRKEHPQGGADLLIYSLPYAAGSAGIFIIEAGASYIQIESTLHGLSLIFAILLPVAMGLAIAGGYMLIKRALKPVDEITRAAEHITTRNLNERLPLPTTRDEIARLSLTLNQMIERLERSFRQIVQFTADASHELRTPLTILRGELEIVLRRNSLNAEAREVIGSVLEETERMSKMVDHLLILSRLDSGELKLERNWFDLGKLCKETVDQMVLLAEDRAIRLECVVSETVELNADPIRVRQILINLMDNAIKHTPAGGLVRITIAKTSHQARIEVTDTGEGIPTEALPYIFDRFYRADRARSRAQGGTGLGLAIAKSTCELHGGKISAEKNPIGPGTCFRVELPIGST